MKQATDIIKHTIAQASMSKRTKPNKVTIYLDNASFARFNKAHLSNIALQGKLVPVTEFGENMLMSAINNRGKKSKLKPCGCRLETNDSCDDCFRTSSTDITNEKKALDAYLAHLGPMMFCSGSQLNYAGDAK